MTKEPPMTDVEEIARELARKEELAREEMILEALRDAYNRGLIEYLHFSAAYDVTATRAAALSFVRAHLEQEQSQ